MAARRYLHLKQSRNLLLGGVFGYTLFWLTSHPTRSPLKRRFPQGKIKNVSYFPNIKISRKEREYWLHHWINLSIIYILLLAKKNRLRKSSLTHGFFLGSIIQGLLYPDRFHIREKSEPLLIPEQVHEVHENS